jgi:mannose-6-phosphate isomerase-like protein (cupin superfamily)
VAETAPPGVAFSSVRRRFEVEPYLLGPEEGESIWMFDALDTIKADADRTGGAFSVFEFLDFEGSTVPLHVHDGFDRGFYILDGEYTFIIDTNTTKVTSGAWVFVPRNVPHAWRCDSSQGRVLNVTVPGGFEDFYRQAGEKVLNRGKIPGTTEPDVAQLSALAARYGTSIVGPPPDPGGTR